MSQKSEKWKDQKNEKSKDIKQSKGHSPSRKHSSESGRDSKHKSKSSNHHEKSSHREKYKSKYQSRKEKKHSEKEKGNATTTNNNFQEQLYEDQKKCRPPIKKSVRFEDEKKLVSQKFFSIVDEPAAPYLTDDQVNVIRKKIAEQISSTPLICSSEELKHKESLMEGLRRRQNEQDQEIKLEEMKPLIEWYYPQEFSMEQKYIWGEESTEIEAHDKRMSTKLRCFYPTFDHIPAEPNFAIINNKYNVKQVQQIRIYTV